MNAWSRRFARAAGEETRELLQAYRAQPEPVVKRSGYHP